MVTAGGGLVIGVLSWLIVIDNPEHLSDQIKPLENYPSSTILVGLKLAIRQKQTWVMAILGAAMSSTLLAFGAL